MKKVLFILYLLPNTAFPQQAKKGSDDPRLMDSLVFHITSEDKASTELRLPFGSIEVIDARFDTSKIGFIFNKSHHAHDFKDFKKMLLSGGVSQAIQEYYNHYYQDCFRPTANRLLIVLKRLWISNQPVSVRREKRYDIERNSLQDIYIKFEYYLQKGAGYHPMLRTDTVYQLLEENINAETDRLKKDPLAFLKYTLKSLIEKNDFNKLSADLVGKKIVTRSGIDSFNAKRYQLPILTAYEYKRGIYLSIREFIDNNPSVKQFKVTENKELIGEEINTEKVTFWAYADNSGIHMSLKEKLNVYRVGNTFEFFANDMIYVSRTTGGKPMKLVYYPRQIDMETGLFY